METGDRKDSGEGTIEKLYDILNKYTITGHRVGVSLHLRYFHSKNGENK